MKKRIFLTLALAILVTLMMSVAVSAALVGYGTCGNNLHWTLDDKGTLTISGTGDMYWGSGSVAPWKEDLYSDSILNVVIEDGVTSIAHGAFYYCTSLTSITIPDSVTSIGDTAFNYCTSLTSVTIPDSVTSIGDHVFYYCTSLTSITIPDSVTSIGDYAFYYCTSLTSITIGNSVTSIGSYAFSKCTSLTSINIPDSVTSIGDSAFYYCTSLTSITIPDSVTSIGEDAFNYCTSLTQINWNAKNVNDFSSGNYVFASAGQKGNGINVVFGESVESIPAYAFYPCSTTAYLPKIVSVTIGNSVTSIGGYAFAYCTSLRSITIPESVTYIGSSAFYGSSPSIKFSGSKNAWSGLGTGKSATCRYGYNDVWFKDITSAEQKGEILNCSVKFSCSSATDNLITTIKYPKYLSIKDIVSKDFYDNSIDTQTSDDTYNYITIISTYSSSGDRTSTTKDYNPFDISFEIPENTLSFTLQFCDDTIAIGDNDYTLTKHNFNYLSYDLEILGNDVVSSPCTYSTNYTGYTYTWSVSDTSIATIDANGLLSPKKEGTVIVTATAKEDTFVSVSKTVTVKTDVTVEILGNDEVYDSSNFMVVLTPEHVIPTDVVWRVSNTSIATITGSYLEVKAQGTVTIYVDVTLASGIVLTASKTVTTYLNAYADSLTTDIGTWDKPFSPTTRNYGILVDDAAESITFTASFTGGGTFKCNGQSMINNRAKTFDLSGVSTEFVFARENVTGQEDSKYTVIVYKNGSVVDIALGAKAQQTNVRYYEINGVQKIAEDDVISFVTSNDMLVEVVEKTSADAVDVVSTKYYFVDATNATYRELNLDTLSLMTNSKSIRTENPMGVRFKAKFSKEAKSETEDYEVEEYGFIIATQKALDNAGAQLNFDFAKHVYGIAYNKADNTDIIFDNSGDEWCTITGVLMNIPKSQYTTSLAAKLYTKINIDGETFTVYSEQVNASVYEIAKALIKSDAPLSAQEKIEIMKIISYVEGDLYIDIGGLYNT